MEFLSYCKEIGSAVKNPPIGIYPDIVHQRHERVQYFGNTTALKSRVDVLDTLHLKPSCLSVNIAHDIIANDMSVIIHTL